MIKTVSDHPAKGKRQVLVSEKARTLLKYFKVKDQTMPNQRTLSLTRIVHRNRGPCKPSPDRGKAPVVQARFLPRYSSLGLSFRRLHVVIRENRLAATFFSWLTLEGEQIYIYIYIFFSSSVDLDFNH